MFQHADGDDAGYIPKTVVAIDRDKNSQPAVKWTVERLLINETDITLLHVVNRSNVNHGFAIADATATKEQLDAEIAELFLPYKGFCARKGVNLNEVVVEDADVSKAIIDYITANGIHNIVVGACTRNVFMKKFKNPDVATNLVRGAPDFCAVYVINKGKPVTVRSAKTQAPASATPPRTASGYPLGDPEDSIKTPFARRSSRLQFPPGTPDRRSVDRSVPPPGLRTPPPMSPFDGESQRGRRSTASRESDDLDLYSSGRLPSMDMDTMDIIPSSSNSSPLSSLDGHSPRASREVEDEMRRLKQELKQTMDMYNAACKEAITAKQKAKELNQWKADEARRFEEARQAEEAALARAEMEKAKARAAMEAAEQAKKIAEMEAQKRMNAELRARREAEDRVKALDAVAAHDLRYRKYSIDEIELATENFAGELKIGEGGYGPVFRATLDHTPVAIKVLRPDAAQGRKQFQQEVEVLSCMRHPNMVLLLGACPEYGCLVYEYMDNGSLEDRLFRRNNTPPIPWPARFRIAAEIATALHFLHQAKPEPLVHRDLKPANILLDRNYVSKISDVGLARLVPPSVANAVTQYRMTSAAGTFCYIDPEYQQTGMLGVKSDVYSFGVLLLQIITARQPMGLTHHVARAIDKGQFEQILDSTVTDWPVEEALVFAKLALKCAELRRKDRPDVGAVVLPELNRLRNLGYEYEANQRR